MTMVRELNYDCVTSTVGSSPGTTENLILGALSLRTVSGEAQAAYSLGFLERALQALGGTRPQAFLPLRSRALLVRVLKCLPHPTRNGA